MLLLVVVRLTSGALDHLLASRFFSHLLQPSSSLASSHRPPPLLLGRRLAVVLCRPDPSDLLQPPNLWTLSSLSPLSPARPPYLIGPSILLGSPAALSSLPAPALARALSLGPPSGSYTLDLPCYYTQHSLRCRGRQAHA